MNNINRLLLKHVLNKNVKFVMHGYEVFSDDGDRHFISGNKLIDLYELPKNQCIISKGFDCKYYDPEKFIHFHPSSSGFYENILTETLVQYIIDEDDES